MAHQKSDSEEILGKAKTHSRSHSADPVLTASGIDSMQRDTAARIGPTLKPYSGKAQVPPGMVVEAAYDTD